MTCFLVRLDEKGLQNAIYSTNFCPGFITPAWHKLLLFTHFSNKHTSSICTHHSLELMVTHLATHEDSDVKSLYTFSTLRSETWDSIIGEYGRKVYKSGYEQIPIRPQDGLLHHRIKIETFRYKQLKHNYHRQNDALLLRKYFMKLWRRSKCP